MAVENKNHLSLEKNVCLIMWPLLLLGVLGSVHSSPAVRHGLRETSKHLRNGLDPFWSEIMIPVVLCLAVILLIVSIFAVALITVRSMQDTESRLVSFVPPGFDTAWERNIQAELGIAATAHWSSSSLRESGNSPIEIITVFPDSNSSSTKLTNSASGHMSLIAPLPIIADNLTEIPFRQAKEVS